MKRIPFLLALALIVVSCASMQSADQSLVSRAVQAEGGADALGAIKTLSRPHRTSACQAANAASMPLCRSSQYPIRPWAS